MKKKIIIIVILSIVIISFVFVMDILYRLKTYTCVITEIQNDKIYCQDPEGYRTSPEEPERFYKYYVRFKDIPLILDNHGHILDVSELKVNDTIKITVLRDRTETLMASEVKLLTNIKLIKVLDMQAENNA